MKTYPYVLVLMILISTTAFAKGNKDKQNLSKREQAGLLESKKGNGMRFTPNKGQITDMDGNLRPDVLYKGDAAGAAIYLRKTGISYVYTNMGEVMHEAEEQTEELIRSGMINEADESRKKQELMEKLTVKLHRVDMDFINCRPTEASAQTGNSNITTLAEDELEGYQNFYYSHCPMGITNVKQYNKVTYKNIYNGIDVSYYGNKEHGIKYDLIVKPHADPNQIKLRWNGAESITLNSKGNLVIKTIVNEFYESIPKVYQNINGKIVDIKAEYKLSLSTSGGARPVINGVEREGLVTFELGTWDPEFPLIIDPWATYYGGNDMDYGSAIATDTASGGNAFITGYTLSTNFPVLPGGYIQAFATSDAYVVKFDPLGLRLWATYYGGTKEDRGTDIATDISGNVCITGFTGSGSGLPVGAIAGNTVQQPASGGSYDAFVVKFNSAGARQWATFYGGSSDDKGQGITTDISGNIAITGFARSPNFPILTAAGYTQAFGGNVDAFVVKFNATGTRLWASVYGGTANESAFGIATDIAGNMIISGETFSANFPIGATGGNNIQQPIFGGGIFQDAFAVKFDPSGKRLWATFYGSNYDDYGRSVATDNLGNVIIAGYTGSPNFPLGACCGNIVQQTVSGGSTDNFLVKFDPTGSRLWATLYGGPNMEFGWGIATDKKNNIYLYTEEEDVNSPNLVDACTYQPIFGGLEDQLIVKYSAVGKRLCTTYMGGSGHDDLDNGSQYGGKAIAINNNTLFITGFTDGGYPVTPGAFQTTYAGGFTNPTTFHNMDAFVATLCTNICEGKSLGLNFTASNTSMCTNVPVTFKPTITNSCDTTGYKYHWVFTGGNPATSDSVMPTASFSGVGTHDVKLYVTTLCKKDSIKIVNYITTTQCTVCNIVGQFTKGTANCADCGCKEWILITASGGTSPYTYVWPDGYVNRYKNQLCPGAYLINIKDKNGCSVNINLTAP